MLTTVQPESAQAAASCELDGTAVADEGARTFQTALDEYIVQKGIDAAQEKVMTKIVNHLVERAEDADGIPQYVVRSIAVDVGKTAQQYLHARKMFAAVEALSAGDYDTIKKMAYDEASGKAIEYFATNALGMAQAGTIVGAVDSTVKIVNESYAQLEHEDCLLNLDLAYYKFLDQPVFQYDKDDTAKKQKAVNAFLDKYIRGEGTDPSGGDKAQNRRNLQCYINTLPKAEQVQISSESAKSGNAVEGNPASGFMSIFGRVTDTLSSTGVTQTADGPVTGNPKLRTPTLMMLNEFNAKKAIEEQREKARLYVQTPEYTAMHTALKGMESYPAIQDFLCSYFGADKGDVDEDLIGRWTGSLRVGFTQLVAEGLEDRIYNTDLTISEDGSITGKVTLAGSDSGDAINSVKGTAEGRQITLNIAHREEGAAVIDYTVLGQLNPDASEMKPKVHGQEIDWNCVFSGFFDDEEDEGPVCGMAAVAGDGTFSKVTN